MASFLSRDAATLAELMGGLTEVDSILTRELFRSAQAPTNLQSDAPAAFITVARGNTASVAVLQRTAQRRYAAE